MAVLALATSLEDLRRRIGKIVVALDKSGKAVTTEDIGVAGAMTILMKDALKPNALQTLEEQLAFVHAGPFANIAHGNSSIVADLIASQIADFVVTESGFGSDMGFEKLMDIKCRASGLMPDAVVLVATVRALKMHGGGPKVTPGKPLSSAYTQENKELLRKGLANLEAHIGIIKKYGLPVVVAINSFPTDTEAEHALIKDAARNAGAYDAVVSHGWERGGEGCAELARAVEKAAAIPSAPELLYPLEMSLKDKIETIAHEVYGAGKVVYTPEAEAAIENILSLAMVIIQSAWPKPNIRFRMTPMSKACPRILSFQCAR